MVTKPRNWIKLNRIRLKYYESNRIWYKLENIYGIKIWYLS